MPLKSAWIGASTSCSVGVTAMASVGATATAERQESTRFLAIRCMAATSFCGEYFGVLPTKPLCKVQVEPKQGRGSTLHAGLAYSWPLTAKGCKPMGHSVVRRYLTVIAAGLLLVLPAARPVSAAPTARGVNGGISVTQERQTITLQPVASNVLQVHVSQAGAPPQPAPLVIDPQSRPKAVAPGKLEDTAEAVALSTPGFLARWDKATGTLTLTTPAGKPLLTQADTASLASGRIVLTHAASDPIYGIRGYFATEPSQAGLLRRGVQVAKSGEQGYAGAPFAWSTTGYGVLVDARPARFNLDGGTLTADGFPKGDFTYYLITGTPPELFSALSRLG